MNLRVGTLKSDFVYSPLVKYDSFKNGYIRKLNNLPEHTH